jgi:hypothetical protein
VWFEHPGHTYGGFGSVSQNRGVTEEGKWKVVSPFSFFKSLLFIFEFFWFYQMQRWAKTNMQWKRRKENGGFGVREKIQMQIVEKKMG